jgi:uncharacterized membrane protein YidH (DUF202 family)
MHYDRRRALGRRATVPRKVIGLVLIVCGLAFTGRGIWHWREPPLPPARSEYSYVMSRQIEDVSTGLMMVVFGVVADRRGLKMFDGSD